MRPGAGGPPRLRPAGPPEDLGHDGAGIPLDPRRDGPPPGVITAPDLAQAGGLAIGPAIGGRVG